MSGLPDVAEQLPAVALKARALMFPCTTTAST